MILIGENQNFIQDEWQRFHSFLFFLRIFSFLTSSLLSLCIFQCLASSFGSLLFCRSLSLNFCFLLSVSLFYMFYTAQHLTNSVKKFWVPFFHINILFLILALVFLSTSQKFHVICWAFTLIAVLRFLFWWMWFLRGQKL